MKKEQSLVSSYQNHWPTTPLAKEDVSYWLHENEVKLMNTSSLIDGPQKSTGLNDL